MISVYEALQHILNGIDSLDIVTLPIEQSMGFALAKTIFATSSLPVYDNSNVDGYAVISEDTYSASPIQPVVLKVIGDIPAGSDTQISISPNQSARIMTGAQIPKGASAVVMVEDTDFNTMQVGSKAPEQVKIFKAIQKEENIRRKGSDIIKGQEILKKGRILRPQDIGILAMQGLSNIQIIRKPRVAIISSGDELIPLSSQPIPGKIYDSNSYMLASLSKKYGAEVISMGIASDNLDSVIQALEQALLVHPDIIIASAGVSAGAYDFMRTAVETSGKLDFWKVNMRPGKPLAFGSYRDVPFFGLPGNPVSAFVSFLVFVLPVLNRMQGFEFSQTGKQKVILAETITSDGRESYLRAVVYEENDSLHAKLTGHQGSGNLFSLIQANALLIIPSGVKSCPPGSEVEAWILEN